jgi:hypothetical protein
MGGGSEGAPALPYEAAGVVVLVMPALLSVRRRPCRGALAGDLSSA